MGPAYASAGISKTVAPLFSEFAVCTGVVLCSSSPLITLLLFSVGAAYEGVQKRTFLAMSIVILIQIFIMLILVLLYNKLGQLRKQQIHVNATKPLLSSTLDSNQDGASDKEDATEMSELLAQKKKPLDLKDSGN